MIRDEFARVLRQELGIDEEYQDWSYRAADHLLSFPVEEWEIPMDSEYWDGYRYPTLQEILDGKARKI